MGIAIAKLEKHFGRHEVPKPLADLFRFGRDKEFFSGTLELTDSNGRDVAVEMLAHLHEKAVATYGDEVRAQLALFAVEPDGSKYALWFHGEQPSAAAPVVFICSEGSNDSGVIADNLGEFLALLRLDQSEVGRFYAVERDPGEPHAGGHEAYLTWADKHGVARAPAKPADRVQHARRKQPNFSAWLNTLNEKCEALAAKTAKPAAAAAPPKPDLSRGVLALEIATDAERVAPALLTLVKALCARDPALEASSKVRLGLTETRAIDTHDTGVIAPEIARASELRIEWRSDADVPRTLVVSPPAKSRKDWVFTFSMKPHPSADAGTAADCAAFEKALSAAGEVKVRRGNAA